jgi:hypothetical protein
MQVCITNYTTGKRFKTYLSIGTILNSVEIPDKCSAPWQHADADARVSARRRVRMLGGLGRCEGYYLVRVSALRGLESCKG